MPSDQRGREIEALRERHYSRGVKYLLPERQKLEIASCCTLSVSVTPRPNY